ncbi:hypothetical protein BHE74_00046552, partial [Ensete ventricosum]
YIKIYALVNIELMARKDPVAAAAQKYKPMQSAVPGTTLGPIQIEAFQGGGVRTLPVMNQYPKSILDMHWKSPGHMVVSIGTITNSEAVGINGSSLFWGGLVRIDVIKVFYQHSFL